ncbi:unnamed protein product [Echinostoma caproni]|uniref:PBPb domain-containing protein n=1 Tax=Echinostoma caproni TaxID=27848 RepID=A0A183B4S4_9TREM|nr:unnamed protein product [Echinostoma caproni]
MMLEDNITVYDTEGGLSALRQNPNLAFICDRFLLQSAVTRNCGQFILLDEVIDETPASFAVRKEAHYGPEFSEYLQSLADTGIIQRLFDKWLPQLEVCNNNHPDYSALDMNQIGGGFVPLVAGALFSAFALGIEWYFKNYRSHHAAQPQNENPSTNKPLTWTPSEESRPPLPHLISDGLRYGGRRRSFAVFDAETIVESTVLKTRL